MRPLLPAPQHKLTRFLLPIIIGASLLACSFADRLASGATHTAAPPPTVAFPTLPPNEPLQPTVSAQAPQFTRAQIGFYRIQYVLYDPSIWEPSLFLDSGGQPVRSPHGEEVQVLSHLKYQCKLHDNLGHGMGEQFQLNVYEKPIGDLLYRVEQWIDTLTGDPILVVYQYPARGDQNTARRIEMTAEDANGVPCMLAVEDILLHSAAEMQ